MSSSTFSYARGAPPPLALTRRRRFAALPSGASLGPRALIKRQRNDARACSAAADVDVELGVGRDVFARQVRHADRLIEKRTLCSSRNRSLFRASAVTLF